jgi:hypothetical protein
MNGITDKIREALASLLESLLTTYDHYRKPRQVVLQPVRSDDERIFRA